MTKQVTIEAGDPPTRMGRRTADAVAVGLAFAAYFITFAMTRPGGIADLLTATARNVLPLAALGLATRAIVVRHVAGRNLARQVAAHAVLAVMFTLGWYWLLTVAGGVLGARSALRFTVAPFLSGQAFEWQLFQGLAAYTAVAALSHLSARPTVPVVGVMEDDPVPGDPVAGGPVSGDPLSGDREPMAEARAEPARDPGLQRYFVRVGEDIVPVDVADIVSIAGADDYAEVTTAAGSHLARMTLAEFEASLDPGRFLRVHRSRIVNTGCIVRAEPAGGGRLLLHMSAGDPVPSSRTGAKLLRDRVR